MWSTVQGATKHTGLQATSVWVILSGEQDRLVQADLVSECSAASSVISSLASPKTAITGSVTSGTSACSCWPVPSVGPCPSWLPHFSATSIRRKLYRRSQAADLSGTGHHRWSLSLLRGNPYACHARSSSN